ncbi:MAG: plasmid pRiA4b ORF-3 family protein [Planctomycetes bacterium]|nr:plasmid pRiA4b ORF-3 family protein [Planctomycetota bacterium]
MEPEKISIFLTDQQRQLLMEKVTIADDNLKRAVSLVLKKDDHYQIILSLTDISALCEAIALQSTKSDKSQDQLDELNDFFDDIFWDISEDVFGDDDFDDNDFDDEDDDNDDELEENISQPTGPVYLFKVMLNDDIHRTIAIRGGQTLEDLHYAIFKAFNRDEDHLYSFYFPPPGYTVGRNVWIMARKSTEYTHPYNMEECYGSDKTFYNAAHTTIDSLNLKTRKNFWYLFDFGDEWWHKITTQKCNEKPKSGKYPRVTEKKGKSPPQYEY